ncbi:hypothetical protein [Sphingomonas sp. Root710]|uniref:hypothetical protein n=1 Tax=Sphingomonas sp. Root710 TaxID=1736594 RepID=UPI0012E37A46|nr:hypothetical protein [Sphingomonas sp. Root710]
MLTIVTAVKTFAVTPLSYAAVELPVRALGQRIGSRRETFEERESIQSAHPRGR